MERAVRSFGNGGRFRRLARCLAAAPGAGHAEAPSPTARVSDPPYQSKSIESVEHAELRRPFAALRSDRHVLQGGECDVVADRAVGEPRYAQLLKPGR